MSLRNSFEQASSSPGFGGLGEAMPRVFGITTIIGFAFLAAMRLSRMNWAWPPWRGSVLRPLRVVVAAAVVQVEHGIPGVAVGLVARRQVDVHPLLLPGVVRVGRLLDLAVGDVGLGVERGVVEGGQGRQDGQLGRPRLRHRRHAAGAPAAWPAGRPASPLVLRDLALARSGGLGSDFGSWAEAAGDPAEASPSTAIERSRRDASMVPDSGRGIGTAPYYRDTSDGAAPSGPK